MKVRKMWRQFREYGLLWFIINLLLRLSGWALIININDNNFVLPQDMDKVISLFQQYKWFIEKS